jgi:hypothetical protein
MTNVHVVDVPDKERNPLDKLLDETNEAGRDLHQLELAQEHENLKENKGQPYTRYSCGGFSWVLPDDCKMDDVVIIWIGHENPALTNIMLSFNSCTVGILFGVFMLAELYSGLLLIVDVWRYRKLVLHHQFSVCR